MTERTGGSDVSGTATLAKLSGNGSYTLHGIKWFTSATTFQMAMALARTEGSPPGSKGLSLFCAKVHDDQGGLNAIEVHRLKDKLGTRALPTAELSLRGTPAEMVGEPGQGVKKIASMINITRLHNSVCALGATARALDLAMDYAQKRQAFGAALSHWPLHMATLQPRILAQEAESISGSIRALQRALQDERGSGDLVAHARDFLMATGHVFAAASLVSAARQQPCSKASTQAQQWCRMPPNRQLPWC
jgi:alkylation response protein AidB-like acyl-CoA dehydrogenase